MAPKNKQSQELSASGPKDKVSFVTTQNGITVPANREQPGLSISLKEYDYIKDKIGKISCKKTILVIGCLLPLVSFSRQSWR